MYELHGGNNVSEVNRNNILFGTGAHSLRSSKMDNRTAMNGSWESIR